MTNVSLFAFDSVMTRNMQLKEENTHIIQITNEFVGRSYMVPSLPEEYVSSVTIQWLEHGIE